MAEFEDDGQLANELMPNSIEYDPGIYVPEVDPEVRQDAAEEETVISSSVPVMAELIEWFDTQIALCDSVHNVVELSKMNHWDISTSIEAHHIVQKILTSKRTDLANAFERFMKGGEE